MAVTAVPAAYARTRGGKCALLRAVLLSALGIGFANHAVGQTVYDSITLDWTAPGDDGTVGQASSYDLRYSTASVGIDTLSWWNGASQATGEPAPKPSGSTDSYTVTNLTQGTTYYFVIRALDEVGNISGFSNVAVGATQSCNAPTSDPGPLSAVADTGQVLVSWSSTVDPLAVSLKLYRGQGANGALSLYRTLSPTPASYLDTSVSPGTTYRYRATWMGSACEGPTSSITPPVTTPGTPPPPPPPPPDDAAGSAIHAYPNPASGPVRLVIEVAGSASQPVLVRLFDMNGHWIATLADGTYPPGPSETTWTRLGRDGKTVVPGYYELLGAVGTAKVRERLVLIP
jgi:fibronectin type III domain protein